MAEGKCTNPEGAPGTVKMINKKPYKCVKVGKKRYAWRIMKKNKKGDYKPDKSLPGAIESIYK